MKSETIQKTQFRVPVLKGAAEQKVSIFSDGDMISLKIPAAIRKNDDCDFIAHYALPRGWKSGSIEAEEEFFNVLEWEDANTPLPVPEDPMRPEAHFTARTGWINDPNGMFYLNGMWHLFYQYNPFGITWGNMHWGHAVSRDLMHWQYLPVTLYPDSLDSGRQGTMYSGSAFIDHANVSGLGENAVLLYYTKHYSDTRTGSQNLAYSTDGGHLFRKYDKNPLVPEMAQANFCERDPNIAYHPEDGCFYMGLYMGNDETRVAPYRCPFEFCLLASHDLLNWEKTDSYIIGDATGQSRGECPGLRYMRDEVSGQWKWVFTDASGLYRVGTIRQGKISFETGAENFVCGNAYAGQFFQNAPGQRHIYMAWLRMTALLSRNFQGVMSSPMEMTLSDHRLLVKPHVLCGEVRRFSCRKRASVPLPEGELVFDMTVHKVFFKDRVWKVPAEIATLNGIIVTDKITWEYFDDTGLFTLCLATRVQN